MSEDAFEECEATLGEDSSAKDMLRCVVSILSSNTAQDNDAVAFSRLHFLLHSAILVFLMQAGFAMLAAGSVRMKNVGNTMLKNLLDACGASIAYFAFGYALSLGGDDPSSSKKTFIGTSGFFLQNVDDDKLAEWTFQFAFAATATTIVAGALAERCQMIAYLSYSFLLVGFVYPVIVHAFWSSHGFLSGKAIDPLLGVGTLDFSGSGVVHLTGGYIALISAKILGPRKGRFHDDSGRELDKPKKMHGHSIALQMLGCMLLWVGWFGFNIGTVLTLETPEGPRLASLVAVNTALSAGMGGLSALFLNLLLVERLTGEAQFDLHFVMNGTLSGAVAITGGCSLVEPWAAVVIGFLAGLFFILGHHIVLRFRVDDCVDAIAVHMVNGIWGLLAVGLFASPKRIMQTYGRSDHVGFFLSFSHNGADGILLLTQIIGIFFILAWVTVTMLPFFIWLDWKGWFRSDPLEELVGLDISYHGGCAMGKDVQPEYITVRSLGSLESRQNHIPSSVCMSETIPIPEYDIAPWESTTTM